MIKFGILGAGGIAHSFHEAINAVPEAKLVAVASKSLERAKQWAKDAKLEENEITCYGDYESFLQNPEIDVVYISTTVNYHYDNIKACLNAGKHVLCEKAMVETRAEAEEVFALAKSKNLFLMEAMWSRFLPKTIAVREWIKQGKIGKVESMQATIGFKAPEDPKCRLYNPDLGGGALYDIGVYLIDLLPYFADKKIVNTAAKIKWAETGVDDTVNLTLELEDGILAEGLMTFSAVVPEDAYIYGSKGYIHIPGIHWGNKACLYNGNRQQIDVFGEKTDPGFAYEIREVVKCINAGDYTSRIASPKMTLASSEIYDTYLHQ